MPPSDKSPLEVTKLLLFQWILPLSFHITFGIQGSGFGQACLPDVELHRRIPVADRSPPRAHTLLSRCCSPLKAHLISCPQIWHTKTWLQWMQDSLSQKDSQVRNWNAKPGDGEKGRNRREGMKGENKTTLPRKGIKHLTTTCILMPGWWEINRLSYK